MTNAVVLDENEKDTHLLSTPSFRGNGSLIAATDFTFPFDGIKRDGPNGEYWSARELFGDATEKGGGRPREDYLLLRFAEGRA